MSNTLETPNLSIDEIFKQEVEKTLSGDLIREVVAKQVKESIEKAISDSIGKYGPINRAIEKKLESIMIPMIENKDFTDYLVKLDSLLTDVIKKAATPNKTIAENFKHLMIEDDTNVITIDDLFAKYSEYVSKNVNTDDLEVDLDDEPMYEYVTVSYETETLYGEHLQLIFKCEQDEKLTFNIILYQWDHTHDEDHYTINYKSEMPIRSLRDMSSFEANLLKLDQSFMHLHLDSDHGEDDIRPEERPEASFS